MFYYEVAPASRQYHGADLLTYCSPAELEAGKIIVVKIRSKPAVAFVVRSVPKPDFKTLEIDEVLEAKLPRAHVELFQWMREYYPAPTGLIAQMFLPLTGAKHYMGNPEGQASSATPAPLPLLTSDQEKALEICAAPETRTAVLHGDTGTGKTRVYLELAKKALAAGRSVLILVPEIALSPQSVKTFSTSLTCPVHVTHSGLTPAKRRKVWQDLTGSKGPQVVIGPRSALFTPLDSIGLIVVDEFHEGAYKQDQAPYYQTIRAAAQYARLHGAKLIMGSATPPVSEYFIAQQKNIPIVRMTQKAATKDPVQNFKTVTKVVNLKGDSEKTRYPLISRSLIGAVKAALGRREQVLLFLNKRGSARVILCQNCGWHALCENCDLPLTYHGDKHRLQCHTCGRSRPAPSVCPECSSHDIIFKSPGTKAIVEAVINAFPEARVARFDRDNTKAESLETRHAEIVGGDIDILVGTQMLAKGHDLPRLGLVGILMAENELQFPDYTSSERSYQLIHQLIGRVGRGHRSGEVIVQTYNPDNIAVQTAVRQHSWDEFYNAQLAERKAFEFPPFFYLMKIEVSRARMPTVISSCEQIMDFIRASGEPVKISGPTPCFQEKRNNTFNWQIIVKAKQRSALTRLARTIPVKCTVNLDPANLL